MRTALRNEQRTTKKRNTMTNERNRTTDAQGSTDARWLPRLRVLGWTLVAVLLLLPAIAMQFSGQVVWTAADFIFAAVVLIGTGLTVEVLVRKRSGTAFRAGAGVALAAALLLTWSNAAVGLVGSGANPANVLYFMLLPVALTGSFAARFRAKGLSITMLAVAIAQLLITVFAFVARLVQPDEVFPVIAINSPFIALWGTSAFLFHHAKK